MSDIDSLLNFVEGRIERLEGDNAEMFASNQDAHLAAWMSVQGVFLFAHEMKRIADILDGAMEVDPENPGAGRYVWVRVREE